MSSLEEWERQLAEFTKKTMDQAEQMAFRDTGSREKYFENAEKAIKDWVTKHPPPIQPGTAGREVTKGIKSTEQFLEERRVAQASFDATRAAEGKRAFKAMMRTRNLRRGTEGVSNLGFVLGAVGTAGFATLVAVVVKTAIRIYIEDKLIEAAGKGLESFLQAAAQATMPNTTAEAEAMY